MREIEFRAWEKSTKTMRGWGELAIPHGTIYLCDCFDDEDYVFMQYTGLKDKNGVEIYEGDIIRYGALALNDFEKYGENCWEQLPKGIDENDISTTYGIYKVEWNYHFLYELEETMICGNPDVTGVEIIGNIYDNPELVAQVGEQK